ncbi:MAG: hypothetical protein ACTTKL_10845 [Treponema sp.]
MNHADVFYILLFLCFIFSLAGWGLLRRKEISTVKFMLGILFICTSPLWLILYTVEPIKEYFKLSYLIISGLIYFLIYLCSLFIVVYKKSDFRIPALRIVFLSAAGLIFSVNSCYQLIAVLESYAGSIFIYALSNLLVLYYLLKMYSLKHENTKVIEIISNISFWLYAIFIHYLLFSFAVTASV